MDRRKYWLHTMLTMANPVLDAVSEGKLKQNMPIEEHGSANRSNYSHLEAFARLINGMSAWLEQDTEDHEEAIIKETYAKKIRQGIAHAVDVASPDYMNFSEGDQPIVDTAFFAQALLRAPKQLCEKLEPAVRDNVITALKNTRSRKPHFSNWLIFSAIIEACLYELGEEDWDPMRVDYALKQFDQWYVGDGHYSDGPMFQADYYNSYVIQPMLLSLIEAVGDVYPDWLERKEGLIERAKQYALFQERLISPEGTFPPIGRSLAYRYGAFHHLANQVLRSELPESLSYGQVREGLTAVIKRTFQSDTMFDENGWLTIGFRGHQPMIGEPYISTGSLYLASFIYLPLGLDMSHPFWSDPDEDWTAKKAWNDTAFPIYQGANCS
ncbi:hypothetical protein JCM21714_3463 [Gracilibacillus boraciitolerans JCM 21714]|uniref:DUF2264 domain-containing protein n=1 Tax=Gracilibacillus boraciitolerans JCM 21714 TaxID=1298598 RepID=W4VMA3_9BACI|nr:DUF2264 domain-containing protein [Gracilibacillus boraciitolerans]GAE94316.1 hypothetical protein JCM21714_3463 [Gracilibacillus boraciitolerans JCM 21714]